MLTDEQAKKTTAALRALDRALGTFPAATSDTDQTGAREALRNARTRLDADLTEIRARDIEITDTNARVDVQAEARWAELVKSGPQIAAEQAAVQNEEN